MPLTFFAHQAVVLPLKLAKPQRFDGVALCVGSMAPDFAYAISGTCLEFASHTVGAQLYWGLPTTLVVGWLFRRIVAVPLASQVRDPLASVLRAIAATRHTLLRTLVSALIGCYSHLALDGATHTDGFIAQRIAWLRTPVTPSITVAHMLQYIGHTIGSVIGAYLLFCWVRRQRGTLEASSAPANPSLANTSKIGRIVLALFSCVALAVAATAFRTVGGVAVPLMRAAFVLGCGFVVASMFVRRDELRHPAAHGPT